MASADDRDGRGDWLAAERTYAALLAEDPANPEIAERLTWIQQEHAPILVGRDDGLFLVGPDLDDEFHLVVARFDDPTGLEPGPNQDRVYRRR